MTRIIRAFLFLLHDAAVAEFQRLPEMVFGRGRYGGNAITTGFQGSPLKFPLKLSGFFLAPRLLLVKAAAQKQKGEVIMKKFTLSLITIMGLMVASAITVMADGTFTGNQLTSAYVPWYQKAAATAGPVEGSAKGGLVLQTGSSLYLEGDSTLHKYQMHANTLLGSAALKSPQGDLAKTLKTDGVDSMELVVPVSTLKSKESGLDDNAYKALSAKDNPAIKFELDSETLKDGIMTAKGNLTIAGVTVPVTLSAATDIKGGSIHLKGVQKLKMSDYKVKPPSISLLVASITCTDEIQIHYDVTFAPAK